MNAQYPKSVEEKYLTSERLCAEVLNVMRGQVSFVQKSDEGEFFQGNAAEHIIKVISEKIA